MCPFNTDDFLIEMTAWAGLTVHKIIHLLIVDFIKHNMT